MRILRLVCAVLLIASLGACTNAPDFTPSQSASSSLSRGYVMPLTESTVDQGPSSRKLADLVDALHAQWVALLEMDSQNVKVEPVGIALLLPEDSVFPLCERGVVFGPSTNGGTYCRAAASAGASAPSRNIVLVDKQYQQAIAGHQGVRRHAVVAALVSYFYTRHLQAEFDRLGVAEWTPGSWAQWCLTGVGMRSLVAEMNEAQTMMAAAQAVREFYPEARGLFEEYQALRKGYEHGSPQTCLEPKP